MVARDKEFLQKKTLAVKLSPEQSMEKQSLEKIDKLENSEEFSLVTLSQNCFLDYLQPEKSGDACTAKVVSEANIDQISELESNEDLNSLQVNFNSHSQNFMETRTPKVQRT